MKLSTCQFMRERGGLEPAGRPAVILTRWGYTVPI